MSYFEDCKFFLRGACVKGLHCGFRHNEASCHTERLCNRWAAGYTCDGRCNLRHPSAAELAALAASPPPTPAAAPVASRAAAPPPGQLSAAKPHVRQQQQQQQQGRDGMAKNARAPAVAAATAPPCRFHARGLCAKGNACPFLHAPPRTAQVAAAAAAANASTATARTPPEKGGRGGKTYPAPNTLRGAAAAARKAADSGKTAAAAPVSRIAGQKGGRQAARPAAGAGRGGVAAAAAGGAATGRAGGGGTGDLGVKAETDAAAVKGRAAEILQKHRLSSSAAALDAKSRGGMSVQGGPPMGKKVRTEPPLRRQPQRPATSGDADAPAQKDPEKQAGKGLSLEGKETEWDCGEEGEWGKADASAADDGAPACDGAVARVPSERPRHEKPRERPEPAVGESSAGAATPAVTMDVAETSPSSDRVPATGAAVATTDAASAQPRSASNGSSSEAASLIPGAAAATLIAGDKEGVPQDRAGGVVGGGGGGGGNDPGAGGGAGGGDGVEPDIGVEGPSQGDAAGETRGKDAEALTSRAGAAVALEAGCLQES